MASEAIIEFVGDPSGLKPLADALKALGQLTDEQVKSFNDANAAFSKFATNTAKEVKTTEKSVKDLNNELKHIPEAVAGGGMKDTTEQFKKVGDSVVSATARLKQLKRELANLKESDPQFKKLAKEAALLQDKIEDVQARVKGLASDTRKLDLFVSAGNSIAAAFSAAQGAAGLFGEQTEDLQKSLLKAQSAMALLNGVQQIGTELTNKAGAAQAAYAIVVGTSTGAMKLFRLALAATGIGLAVIAITALVQNFDKVKAKVEELVPGLKNFGDTWTKIKDNFFAFLSASFEGLKIYGELLADFFTGHWGELIKDAREAGGRLSDAFNNELIDRQKEHKKEFEQAMTEADIITNKRQLERLEAMGKDTLALRETIAKQELSLLEKNTPAYYDKLLELEKIGIERVKKQREEDLKDIKFDPNAAQKQADEVQKILEEAFKQKDVVLKPKTTKIEIPNVDISEESKRTLGDRLSEAFTDKAVKEAAVNSAQEIFNTIFTISNANRKANFDAEIDALEKEKEAKLSNKRLSEAQKAKIEEQFKKKEAKIKEEQFRKDRTAAIIQALINGALGITKTIASLGFPAAIPAIVAESLAIGLQVATIKAQPIPKFAKGTKDAPEGLALVGEQGAELVHLPKGAKVIPHPATMKVLNGSVDADKILRDYNIEAGGVAGAKIDYEKLADALDKRLLKHERPIVNIDENGFITYLQSENHRRTIINKRFKIG